MCDGERKQGLARMNEILREKLKQGEGRTTLINNTNIDENTKK
jgi:hypothetical protein